MMKIKNNYMSKVAMQIRFRSALPMIAGILTVILTLWDIYNWSVIKSMGMAWDTGAPIWPYQASDILLRVINLPAFLIAMPIANLLGCVAPKHHYIVLPISLFFWWFAGFLMDKGLIRQVNQRSLPVKIFLLLLSCLFLYAAIYIFAGFFRWWHEFGEVVCCTSLATTLEVIRLNTPVAWCIALSLLFAKAARDSFTGTGDPDHGDISKTR